MDINTYIYVIERNGKRTRPAPPAASRANTSLDDDISFHLSTFLWVPASSALSTPKNVRAPRGA